MGAGHGRMRPPHRRTLPFVSRSVGPLYKYPPAWSYKRQILPAGATADGKIAGKPFDVDDLHAIDSEERRSGFADTAILGRSFSAQAQRCCHRRACGVGTRTPASCTIPSDPNVVRSHAAQCLQQPSYTQSALCSSQVSASQATLHSQKGSRLGIQSGNP
jgi:hypothetical protein